MTKGAHPEGGVRITTARANFQSIEKSEGTLFDKAYEKEAMILGKILFEPEKFPQIKTRLTPRSFLHAKNRLVYEAMLELHETETPINLLSLYDCLKVCGQLETVGGCMYLTYLAEVAIGEQIARDAKETDRLLEHLKRGGVIKYEQGAFKYED